MSEKNLAIDLIDELKRLERTSTPAPWVSHRFDLWQLNSDGKRESSVANFSSMPDKDLVWVLRNYLPRIIQLLEAGEAANESLTAIVADAVNWTGFKSSYAALESMRDTARKAISAYEGAAK